MTPNERSVEDYGTNKAHLERNIFKRGNPMKEDKLICILCGEEIMEGLFQRFKKNMCFACGKEMFEDEIGYHQ